MRIRQVLADMRDCSSAIEDEALLRGATVIGEHAQRYVPHGLTLVVFLAESHIMLTTWPEFKMVLVDVLLCNPEMDEDAVVDEIARLLCPDGLVEKSYVTRYIEPLEH
jgi:S-adenosylmethionine decarboxylase